MNIPNSLSLLRIALIPCFVVVFYLPVGWARIAAAVLFTMAALTDWLDGYLEGLEAVTPEDVLRVAQTYLRPQNRIVGIYQPVENGEVPA